MKKIVQRHVKVVWLMAVLPVSLLGQQFRAISEFLSAEDIEYSIFSVNYSQPVADFELTANWVTQLTEIDYQSAGFPIDIATVARTRDEQYNGGSLLVSTEWKDRWTASGGLSFYEGFTSHESIWLDEYYRQLWTGRSISGDAYREADPKGLSVDFGMRWEYLRSNAYLELSGSYSQVTIAPGYEFEIEGERAGELVRGIEDIDIASISLSSDNNLTPWLRVKNSVVVSSTTGRDPRFTYLSAGNFALGDRWVLRASAAYAKEGSDFDSSMVGATLIFLVNDQLSFQFTSSFYRDNGEIEQANLATDAAPGKKGTRLFAGVVWKSVNERHRFSFNAGVYENKYDSLGIDKRFEPLYQNRQWDLIKLAYEFQF